MNCYESSTIAILSPVTSHVTLLVGDDASHWYSLTTDTHWPVTGTNDEMLLLYNNNNKREIVWINCSCLNELEMINKLWLHDCEAMTRPLLNVSIIRNIGEKIEKEEEEEEAITTSWFHLNTYFCCCYNNCCLVSCSVHSLTRSLTHPMTNQWTNQWTDHENKRKLIELK